MELSIGRSFTRLIVLAVMLPMILIGAGLGCGSSTTAITTQTPTASLTATPASITAGQSSQIAWSSTNATSCSGTGFTVPNSATSGSATASPTTTTTYSVTCSGAGGSASASAKVTVTPVPVTVTKVTASCTPTTIAPSETSQCSAVVTHSDGSKNTEATWTATGGAITSSGVFTPTGTGTATVTAISTEDTNMSGSATITVVCAGPVLSSLSTPGFWSHGIFGLQSIIIPLRINGSCMEAGDVMSFGAPFTDATLIAGTDPNEVDFYMTMETYTTVPVAHPIVDTPVAGPASNTLYWGSWGDQNLGGMYADGTWVSVQPVDGSSVATAGSVMYHWDATGNQLGSCLYNYDVEEFDIDQSTGNVVTGAGTVNLPDSGNCGKGTIPGDDGKDWNMGSSTGLNGFNYVTRPVAQLVSRIQEGAAGAIPVSTPTSGTGILLSAVCNQPWSSAAITIAGQDYDVVACRDEVGAGTTPTLVQVNGGTMAVTASTELKGFTPSSSVITAQMSNVVSGSILAVSILKSQQIIAVLSGYDGTVNFYSASTLAPMGGISASGFCPNPYRIAADTTNTKFVVACHNVTAPVTTFVQVDPMTGTWVKMAATVADQDLATLLVSQDGTTILGATLGQSYVLDNK